jgi:4-hydroxy-tetrahydrodipicolinate synthase
MAWQESIGCAGIVVCGTNGEAASLTLRERKQLITLASRHRGELQIVAGTGTSSLGETIHLTRHAADEGCVAALVMPPYYFKDPPQEGVRAYYEKVLDAASLPVLLYNIPRLTDTPLSLSLVTALRDHPRLGGIKDSSFDIDYLRAVTSLLPDKWVLTGAEAFLLECLRLGGAGTVSGVSNAYPELGVAVVRAFDSGSSGEGGGPVEAAQQRLTEMNNVIRSYPTPASNKAVLNARGLPGGHMRLPLLDLSPSETCDLLSRLATIGLPVTPDR